MCDDKIIVVDPKARDKHSSFHWHLTLIGAFAPALRVLVPVLHDVTQFIWRVTQQADLSTFKRRRYRAGHWVRTTSGLCRYIQKRVAVPPANWCRSTNRPAIFAVTSADQRP